MRQVPSQALWVCAPIGHHWSSRYCVMFCCVILILLAGFDYTVAGLLVQIGKNRSIRKLCIGKNVNTIKAKWVWMFTFYLRHHYVEYFILQQNLIIIVLAKCAFCLHFGLAELCASPWLAIMHLLLLHHMHRTFFLTRWLLCKLAFFQYL